MRRIAGFGSAVRYLRTAHSCHFSGYFLGAGIARVLSKDLSDLLSPFPASRGASAWGLVLVRRKDRLPGFVPKPPQD